MTTNFTIRDEIREYWSLRAETFDFQPGHEIFSDREKKAWYELFQKHLGSGADRRVLDLACGTGVISHLLFDLGFKVTGLDWSDAMLVKARTKSKKRNSNISFLVADAERTGEDEGSYDVIVMRHLVWTLVDPQTAFAHWFTLLKPGGKLLIIDGDFVRKTTLGKILNTLRTGFEKLSGVSKSNKSPAMVETHQRILSQVYFKDGAKETDIAAMLEQEGFCDIEIQTNLSAINRAQRVHMGFLEGLERLTLNRYAICVSKPLD